MEWKGIFAVCGRCVLKSLSRTAVCVTTPFHTLIFVSCELHNVCDKIFISGTVSFKTIAEKWTCSDLILRATSSFAVPVANLVRQTEHDNRIQGIRSFRGHGDFSAWIRLSSI